MHRHEIEFYLAALVVQHDFTECTASLAVAPMGPVCRSSADDVPRSTDGMVTAALTNPLSISDVSSGWVQVCLEGPAQAAGAAAADVPLYQHLS
jgi:hypothetical protein